MNGIPRNSSDILIAYLNQDDDAVPWHVEDARRKCVLVAGDLADPAHCRAGIGQPLWNSAESMYWSAMPHFQMSHSDLEEISDEEWDYTFRLNIGAYFYLTKGALPHMGPGSSVIVSSVNSGMPSPTLAPYAATKAAIANIG